MNWKTNKKLSLLSFGVLSIFFSGLLIAIKSFFFQDVSSSVYEIWWKGFYRKSEVNTQAEPEENYFGNAQGIIEKLPYIKSLGVDYVWITPFFQSPQMDNGYDISNPYDIDWLFGTISDVSHLISSAHTNNLKIIVDLVMNHTSFYSPYFLKAIGYKGNLPDKSISKKDIERSIWYEKRWDYQTKGDFVSYIDYSDISSKVKERYKQFYFFKEIRNSDENKKLPWWDDKGLNDGFFKPTPYTRLSDYIDEGTWDGNDLFYLHTFSWFQPDLNWDNPEVRKEMSQIADFWLKKGVDGFRFDSITFIGKSEKNGREKLVLTSPDLALTKKRVIEFEKGAKNWRNNLFTIGELSQGGDTDNSDTLLAIARDIFSTYHTGINYIYEYEWNGVKYDFPLWRKDIAMYFDDFVKENNFRRRFGSPPALIFENHDHPRSVSRFGAGNEKPIPGKSAMKEINNTDVSKILARAKALAAFKNLHPGNPILYQGQELGMTNYPFKLEEIKRPAFRGSIDLQTRTVLDEFWLKPDSSLPKRFIDSVKENQAGRDHTRTPIQWNDQENAGWEKNMVFWNGNNSPRQEDYFARITSKKGYFDEFRYKFSNYMDKDNNFRKERVSGLAKAISILKKNIADNEGEYLPQIIFQNNASPLVLNHQYKTINVSQQENNADSPLTYYKHLLTRRKTIDFNNLLSKGRFCSWLRNKDFKVVNYVKNYPGDKPVVAAYTLSYKDKKLLVMTELGNKKENVKFSGYDPNKEVLDLGFNTVHLPNETLQFKDAGVYVQWLPVDNFLPSILFILFVIFFALVFLLTYQFKFKNKKRKE